MASGEGTVSKRSDECSEAGESARSSARNASRCVLRCSEPRVVRVVMTKELVPRGCRRGEVSNRIETGRGSVKKKNQLARNRGSESFQIRTLAVGSNLMNLNTP